MVGSKVVPGGRNMLMKESGPQLMNDINAFHVEWHTRGDTAGSWGSLGGPVALIVLVL